MLLNLIKQCDSIGSYVNIDAGVRGLSGAPPVATMQYLLLLLLAV